MIRALFLLSLAAALLSACAAPAPMAPAATAPGTLPTVTVYRSPT